MLLGDVEVVVIAAGDGHEAGRQDAGQSRVDSRRGADTSPFRVRSFWRRVTHWVTLGGSCRTGGGYGTGASFCLLLLCEAVLCFVLLCFACRMAGLSGLTVRSAREQ